MIFKVNKFFILIYLLISLLCVGCNTDKPPLEFAPNPTVIEKAINFRLQKQHQSLSQKLKTRIPELKITKINITKIEPTIIGNLPTYHLEGTYRLNIKQNKLKNLIIKNTFKLDLQRQSQGKTWRILVKAKQENSEKYFSYQIW